MQYSENIALKCVRHNYQNSAHGWLLREVVCYGHCVDRPVSSFQHGHNQIHNKICGDRMENG